MDELQMLGSLASPEGKLSIGHLPGSRCLWLLFALETLPSGLAFVLDTYDIETLLDTLTGLPQLSAELPPKSVRAAAWLAPRPSSLVLHLLKHEDGSAGLLLLLVQGRNEFVLTLDAAACASLEKMLRARGAVEQTLHAGTLTRFADSIEVGGRRLQWIAGASWIRGIYGECLQLDELLEGTPVLVDAATDPAAAVFLVVQAERLQTASAGNEPPDVAEQCALGNESNQLMGRGQLLRAQLTRRRLVQLVETQKKKHAYILAKLALAELLDSLLLGDLESAHALWRSSEEPSSALSLGVMFLEKMQTSGRDFLLFQRMCGWLHSLNPHRQQAQEAVNGIMQACYKFARDEEKNGWLCGLTLRNWRLHLGDIFEDDPVPPGVLAAWEEACRDYKLPVHPKVICLGVQDAWAFEWDDVQRWQTEKPRPWWKRLLGIGSKLS